MHTNSNHVGKIMIPFSIFIHQWVGLDFLQSAQTTSTTRRANGVVVWLDEMFEAGTIVVEFVVHVSQVCRPKPRNHSSKLQFALPLATISAQMDLLIYSINVAHTLIPPILGKSISPHSA
jgi:hypothetical protein